jgi:NitT/TauT family transport system ATP-binding protein
MRDWTPPACWLGSVPSLPASTPRACSCASSQTSSSPGAGSFDLARLSLPRARKRQLSGSPDCFRPAGLHVSSLLERPTASSAHLAAAGSAAIVVDGVAHTHRGQSGQVEALRRIDLSVPAGQFVAVLGPSGCGKTTLLRILSGLQSPSSGRALLAGEPPVAARRRRAIGWLAQEDGLLPWLSVLDNVRLPLRIARQTVKLPLLRAPRSLQFAWRSASRSDDDGEAAEVLLRRVGLGGSSRQYPHELSGGMRQRAALARAVVARPRFLLLDEPFAHLDELTRERLGELLLELRSETESPPTTVLITHSVSEALLLADRVVVLSARPGQVLLDRTIDLPRPRREDDPAFGTLVRGLKAALNGSVLGPDEVGETLSAHFVTLPGRFA